MTRTRVAQATIPFNRPYVASGALAALEDVLGSTQMSGGNGPYGLRCEAWLERTLDVGCALLVPSGTAALELAAMLLDLEPGDEVIMPSFTFATSASAVVRAGGTPVFADIDARTLNVDPAAVAAAITPRTRAVMVVHYAGGACDMDALQALCRAHGLTLLEDAAHAVMARHRDRPLGSIGALAALSFHETKNLSCGEGGALLVNDPALLERAEILREKGTNRARFHRGEVDKYTWLEAGSSYVLSEVSAALLWSQLESAEEITERRLEIWHAYREAFAVHEGRVRGPVIDDHHNGHIFYLLARDVEDRDALIAGLRERGIHAVFHYVPLHSSPAGLRFGRAHGSLSRTDDASARLLRLPLWAGMTDAEVERVVDSVHAVLV
jgi:dTDP-4-amino-4,6-dideoxygalactose transaminase